MIRIKDNLRKIIFNIVLCIIILGVVYFLHYFRPVAYLYLIAEDTWGDFGGFSCYVLACVFIAVAVKIDKNLLKAGYVLMFLGLFFIGMEEISWGQRLLHLHTPYFVARFNYQSEITLHNIVNVEKPLKAIFCSIVFIWTLILPALALRFEGLQRWIKRWGVPVVPSYLVPYFILALFFLTFELITLACEIGESLTAFAFFLLASDILVRVLRNSLRWKIPSYLATCYLAIALLGLTSFMVFIGSDTNGLRQRLYWTAMVGYPEHDLYSQPEKLFLYMLSHKHLKSDDSLFQYGLFLKKISSDKANAILRASFAEQYRRMEDKPDAPEPHRIAGTILKLLNQKDKARLEFQKALEKYQRHLQQAKTKGERCVILMTMGEIYFEAEDYELALSCFKESSSLAFTMQERMDVQAWINKIKLVG